MAVFCTDAFFVLPLLTSRTVLPGRPGSGIDPLSRYPNIICTRCSVLIQVMLLHIHSAVSGADESLPMTRHCDQLLQPCQLLSLLTYHLCENRY